MAAPLQTRQATAGVPVGEGDPAKDRAFYAGAGANAAFNCVVQLSDQTLLIGGSAANFDWLPQSTQRISLADPGITGDPAKTKAFLLQLSADASSVNRLIILNAPAAHAVTRIRTTSMPGAKTGDLFISGPRGDLHGGYKQSGYFIARLDGNLVDRVPTKLLWASNVAADGEILEKQPWDVGSDGKVILGSGSPHGYDWVDVQRLSIDGQPDVVEDWRLHFAVDGKEWIGTPASKAPFKVVRSAIVLKVWGRPDFRSWTQEDYDRWLPDGNGGQKKGMWPWDMFFEGPANPADPSKSPRGRGYIGYAWPSIACGNIQAITVDRRTNDFVLGGNNKSSLPKGPDFEPYVIAMTHSGAQKWWMRLYREVPPKPGRTILDDQDERLSTPDQYIDGMEIDYSSPLSDGGDLAVVARCHGNNNINFWKGNEIKNPRASGKSFEPSFVGKNGNAHYCWLGRMTLAEGTMLAATYVAEYAEGAKVGPDTWPDPNLDGWPAFTSGWPDLNTTRVGSQIEIDGAGNIYIVGIGRRPVTTANAYMKNLKPGEGVSQWTEFVRVYKADLTTLKYSSILHGRWNPKTGQGGADVNLRAVFPTTGGLVVAGTAPEPEKGAGPVEPMPTKTPPAWAVRTPQGQTAVFGLLHFSQR